MSKASKVSNSSSTAAEQPSIAHEEVIMALAQLGQDPSVKHAQAVSIRLDASVISVAADRSAALREAITLALAAGPVVTPDVPAITLQGDQLIVRYEDTQLEVPDYTGVARDLRTNRLVLTTLVDGIRDIAFLKAATMPDALTEAKAFKEAFTSIDWVYFSPSSFEVIDLALPTGKTRYGNKSYAEVVAQHPDIVKIAFDDAIALRDARYLDCPVRTISRKDFIDAFEILPPDKWCSGQGSESFMMSEHYSGDITSIYVRLGSDYLTFLGRTRMTHDDIVTHARAALPEARRTPAGITVDGDGAKTTYEAESFAP